MFDSSVLELTVLTSFEGKLSLGMRMFSLAARMLNSVWPAKRFMSGVELSLGILEALWPLVKFIWDLDAANWLFLAAYLWLAIDKGKFCFSEP